VFVAPIELNIGSRGKLLGAMACGLPVVATSLAAFSADPVNKKEMLITDDYDEFSRYVIELLKDKQLRNSTARHAIGLAKTFGHIHAAEKLEHVLLGNDMRAGPGGAFCTRRVGVVVLMLRKLTDGSDE
jgi:glycosyltransferase involved in cell wall biosynthesis